MIKLIVTDMDGTVVDSMSMLRTLGIALLAAVGNSELSAARAHYDATVGKPFAEQMAAWTDRVPNGHSMKRTVDSYEMVHESSARYFPFTDFGHALSRHRADAEPFCQFALITSTSKTIVDTMTQLRDIPFAYIGGYKGTMETTKAQQLMDAMRQLHIFAPEVCYVGDSPSDEVIAKLCGVPFFHPSSRTLEQIVIHSGGVQHTLECPKCGRWQCRCGTAT